MSRYFAHFIVLADPAKEFNEFSPNPYLKRIKPLTDIFSRRATMSVRLICPNLNCRKLLSVPDEMRGMQVKCQHCQTTFRVPEAPQLKTQPTIKLAAK